MDKFVKVDDLNALEVTMKSCSPMYTLVSYRAGYQQAIKDIKKAYNGLTVYETGVGAVIDDIPVICKECNSKSYELGFDAGYEAGQKKQTEDNDPWGTKCDIAMGR